MNDNIKVNEKALKRLQNEMKQQLEMQTAGAVAAKRNRSGLTAERGSSSSSLSEEHRRKKQQREGDNLDPMELEKYRKLRDTFEIQYKQMNEEWNILNQKLKIRNDKKRLADIRKELLDELNNN